MSVQVSGPAKPFYPLEISNRLADNPSDALVLFDGKESRSMTHQLAKASKLRLHKRAGLISEEDMPRINEAIKIQLDIY